MTEAEAIAELQELLSNKSWRMENLYYITDKRGQKIKFKPNKVQREYRAAKHTRNVILKARQKGLTTEACVDALDDCLFTPNFHAGIIAHNLDDAEKIFTNKVKFAFDGLPGPIRAAREPRNDRAGELRFPNGSSISVSTSFRGGTLQKLHVSEFGKICAKFPEKAREIVTGAFNAVPLDGEINVESTAEGMDGYFFDMCEAAQLKDPKALTPMDFKFHFFPWHEADEYRLNPIGITIPDALKGYFARLKSDYGITLDEHQKAWYVKKYEEQGEDMAREYPSYPEEAFQGSGRPVFSQDQLASDIRKAKDKKHQRGYVINGEFQERERGGLVVFQTPMQGEAYSIGADVAEGLEHGDHSTACVLNKNFEQVAVYKGHLDPDLFGKLLVELGKYYNQALLIPELNNHGHATIAAIKNENYFMVYRRDGATEELGQETLDKIGWVTNVKSKMKMLDDLKASYRDGSLKLNHEETLREMRTLTYEEDGNVTLNSKDLCVATGLAIQGLSQAVVPSSLGVFNSSGRKQTYKTLEEMLNSNSDEESYFD